MNTTSPDIVGKVGRYIYRKKASDDIFTVSECHSTNEQFYFPRDRLAIETMKEPQSK